MDPELGLAKLASEFWRLLRLYERTIAEQPPDKHPKGAAQFRYASNRLKNILNEHGLRLMVYEGQPYSPNLPVTVVNSDDFENNEGLFIGQTLEPTVISDGRILLMGKVVLKKQ